MKKLFAIVLAVVMVLGVSSMAFAGTWDPAPADPASDFGYSITVEKYALQSGLFAFSFTNSSNIAAANGADVYYAIKLTVPNKPATNAVRGAAEVTITYDGIAGTALTDSSISTLDAGKYYYDGNGNWVSANVLGAPGAAGITTVQTPVVQARCFDTTSAKITAQVVSNRPLTGLNGMIWKGYTLAYATGTNAAQITFTKGGENVIFAINNSDSQASKLSGTQTGTSTFESSLFATLGFTHKELNDGLVYFSNKNLRTVLGFTYAGPVAAQTWGTANIPIITDPTIGIPKTGDNASVIGFAMIMVAVVAAAVAVKKVNA